MVQLKTESNIDKAKYPLTFIWDSSYRKARAHYEDKEQLLTTNIAHSKKMNWIYKVLYYGAYERQEIDLKITKQLKKLGSFSKDEIDEYSKLTGRNINNYIEKACGKSMPYKGLGVGIVGQYFVYKSGLGLLHNMAVLALPVIYELLYERYNVTNKLVFSEFLGWNYKRRRAQSMLEAPNKVDQSQIDQFKKNFPEESLTEIFKLYLKELN